MSGPRGIAVLVVDVGVCAGVSVGVSVGVGVGVGVVDFDIGAMSGP